MSKCLVVILVILGLISCTKKNEQYYQSHPNELQQAIKMCPNQKPQGFTCDQLQKIAGRMNYLAYQLQQSPQGFGTRILDLQQSIAKLKLQANKDSVLKATMTQNKLDLAEHLAVVKWLESPAS